MPHKDPASDNNIMSCLSGVSMDTLSALSYLVNTPSPFGNDLHSLTLKAVFQQEYYLNALSAAEHSSSLSKLLASMSNATDLAALVEGGGDRPSGRQGEASSSPPSTSAASKSTSSNNNTSTTTPTPSIDPNNNNIASPGRMETNITLWQFLLELLQSNQYKNIIAWTNNDGEFKLINAEEVARLWGMRKNKTNMNYDKLSRALRYYYDKDIIKKVLGQKFVYKFVNFATLVNGEKAAMGGGGGVVGNLINPLKLSPYSHAYLNQAMVGSVPPSPSYQDMKDHLHFALQQSQRPHNTLSLHHHHHQQQQQHHHSLLGAHYGEANNNNIYFASMEPTDLSFKTSQQQHLSKKRIKTEIDNESISSDGTWTESSDNGSTSFPLASVPMSKIKRAKLTANFRSATISSASPVSNRSSSPISNRSGASSPINTESCSNFSNDCSPVNLSSSDRETGGGGGADTKRVPSSSSSSSSSSNASAGANKAATSVASPALSSTSSNDNNPSKAKESISATNTNGTTGVIKNKVKPPPISAIPSSPTRFNTTYAQSLQTPIVPYASPFLAKHTPAMFSSGLHFFNQISPLMLSPRVNSNVTHFQFPTHFSGSGSGGASTAPPTPTSLLSMPLSPLFHPSVNPFSPRIMEHLDPQMLRSPQSKSISVLQ